MRRGAVVAGEAVLLAEVWRATSALERLVGLLGREPFPLWFEPCAAIHTFGMRRPIDVVFLDRDGRVLAHRVALPPGRVLGLRGAAAVLELPAGTLPGLGAQALSGTWRWRPQAAP